MASRNAAPMMKNTFSNEITAACPSMTRASSACAFCCALTRLPVSVSRRCVTMSQPARVVSSYSVTCARSASRLCSRKCVRMVAVMAMPKLPPSCRLRL